MLDIYMPNIALVANILSIRLKNKVKSNTVKGHMRFLKFDYKV